MSNRGLDFFESPKGGLDFFKSPKGGLEFLHKGFGIFYFLSKGVWGTHKRGFEFQTYNRGHISRGQMHHLRVRPGIEPRTSGILSQMSNHFSTGVWGL